MKTQYRERRIPVTQAIAAIIKEISDRSDSDYIFTMGNGAPFTAERFQRQVSVRALKAANITYRKTGTIRRYSTAIYQTL